MKKLLIYLLLATGLMAAPDDLILSQAKNPGPGNIQRNLAPVANGFFTFNASKVPQSLSFLTTSTTGVQFASTATSGLRLYNTADQVTNVERAEALWGSNIFQLGTRTIDTATSRQISIFSQGGNAGALYSRMDIGSANSPVFRFGIFTSATNTTNYSNAFAGTFMTVLGAGTSTVTSGSVIPFAITPTYNQASGNASNTDLLIDRTETAIGSGAQYWEDRRVGGISRMATGSAKVLTTDATVTTVQTYTIPASTTWAFDGYVVCRRTGGSSGTAEDGASYRVEGVIKNVAGTATSIGSTVTVIGESQAAWDVTVDVTGATARIRVTGAANNNISWVWTGNVRQVSS